MYSRYARLTPLWRGFGRTLTMSAFAESRRQLSVNMRGGAYLGVIAGIVFLAIEVRQNQISLDEANAINRASSSAAALEYLNEFRRLLAQDEQLAEIWLRGSSGGELSPVGQVRFDRCHGVVHAYDCLWKADVD